MAIPASYSRIREESPALVAAYESFGQACKSAGPLDARTIAMVKLAISIGAGLEGAAHSHARKALLTGCTAAELLHVAHLAAPTIGFPTMMRGRGWVLDVLEDRGATRAGANEKEGGRAGRTRRKPGAGRRKGRKS